MKPSREEREIAELDELVDQHIRYPHLLTSSQVLEAADTECEFLTHNAIPKRAVTFIVGQSGEGKSWVAYDLAMSTARGTPWLGRPCDNPGKVLVLNYDNPTGELGRRFKRLGMTPEDPIVFHSSEEQPLKLPEYGRVLNGIVQRVRPALVLFDSFRQAHTSDENNSKEMAEVMSQLKSMTVLGAAVVSVHHTAKNPELSGLLSARGSGEIIGSSDAVLFVNKGQVEWVKTRCWRMDESPSVKFEVRDYGETTNVLLEGDKRPAADLTTLKQEVNHYLAAGGNPTIEAMAKALHRRSADVREAARALERDRK